MTKTNILITGFEDSEDGSRTRFKTANHGWLSAFKNDGSNLLQLLKDHTNRLISCEVVASKKLKQDGTPYMNIREFYNVVDDNEVEIDTTPVKPKDNTFFKKAPSENTRKSVKGSAYEKDPVGLAVEVFNTIYEKNTATHEKDIMEASINVVKQAQEAW